MQRTEIFSFFRLKEVPKRGLVRSRHPTPKFPVNLIRGGLTPRRTRQPVLSDSWTYYRFHSIP